MIKTIRHKGLKRLWTTGDGSKLPADQLRRIRFALDSLDAATKPQDIAFPGARLHQLKGDMAGHWSVVVNGNWRITFQFKDGDAYVVDYVDYH